jgi:hypothetical protein
MHGVKSGIHSNWTDTNYNRFHVVWPFCAIVFKYSHKRKGSREVSSFWTETALCKEVVNCIRVYFITEKESVLNESVSVKVTVNGTCHYASAANDITTSQRTNRCPLTGH